MSPYYLLWIIAECLLLFINHANFYTEQVYINGYDTMIAKYVNDKAEEKYEKEKKLIKSITRRNSIKRQKT